MSDIIKQARGQAAVTKRLENRLKTAKVSSYISPIPISGFSKDVPEDGVVLRYMFPSKGKIVSACLFLGCELKKNTVINVSIKLSSVNGIETGTSVPVRKNFSPVAAEYACNVGDRLEVSVNCEEPINNVWIAFLWQPSIKAAEAKKFLLSELNGEQDEGI